MVSFVLLSPQELLLYRSCLVRGSKPVFWLGGGRRLSFISSGALRPKDFRDKSHDTAKLLNLKGGGSYNSSWSQGCQTSTLNMHVAMLNMKEISCHRHGSKCMCLNWATGCSVFTDHFLLIILPGWIPSTHWFSLISSSSHNITKLEKKNNCDSHFNGYTGKHSSLQLSQEMTGLHSILSLEVSVSSLQASTTQQ